MACEPLRVACIGDSLTRGDGSHERSTPPHPGRGNYPEVLARLLGSTHFSVRNFGHGGTTACNLTSAPYVRTREFNRAVRWRPHLVVLMLGTNDAKRGDFDKKCDPGTAWLTRGISDIVKALGAPPTLVLEPPPVLLEKWRIRKRHLTRVRRHVVSTAGNHTDASCRPGGQWLARPYRSSHLADWRYFTADGVHLNQDGSRLIACASFESLVGACAGQRLGGSTTCTFEAPAPAPEGPKFSCARVHHERRKWER